MIGLFLLFHIGVAAQDKSALEKEVNEKLWLPFVKAYQAKDYEAYNGLHTDDVIRVNSWGFRIGADYKRSIKDSYTQPNQRERTIAFAFEDRQYYKDSLGYEVGYYRVTYTEPGKPVEQHFGRFHVVLRKERDRWRIAQDWDTDKVGNKPITEADFLSAAPLTLN